MKGRTAEPFRATIVPEAALDRWLRVHSGDPELAAGDVARAQRGAIATRQLLRLGIGETAIRWRTRRGRLPSIFRGVRLWGGGVPATGARETAAILAGCGHVALGEQSAAAMWGMCPVPRAVTVVRLVGGARSRTDLLVLRPESLSDGDIVRYCGLPVTSPLRTLYDLAAQGYPRLEAATSAAHAAGLIDARALTDYALEHRHLPGGLALARVAALEAHGHTDSQNERRMRALCRDAGLPQPKTGRSVGRWRVDFLWPEHGLVLEVDAPNTHGGALEFERDRRKQRELLAAGLPMVRVTEHMLHHEPLALIADLAATIARLDTGRLPTQAAAGRL